MAHILPDPSNAPAVCEVCGVGFIPVRASGGKLCSMACLGKAHTARWFASDRCPKEGQQFGEWTVLRYAHTKSKGYRHTHFFLCRCSCGREAVVHAYLLFSGASWRCSYCSKHASRNLSHGGVRGRKPSPEYKAWDGMRQRCSNPKCDSWARYGGRGIQVCERWQKFEDFLADMGPKPSPKHSLDRIDSEKGYSPDNCRWATVQEQNNNRSNNQFLTFDGRTQTQAQWAQEIGLTRHMLHSRLKAGWSVERALTEPSHTASPSSQSRKR